MAIAKMKKLTMVGLLCDKEDIFDAIVKTKSVELISTAEFEGGADCDRLQDQLDSIDRALSTIKSEVEKYNLENKDKPSFKRLEIPKRGITAPFLEISFEDFVMLGEQHGTIFSKIEEIEATHKNLSNCFLRISKLEDEVEKLTVYSRLAHPISYYKSTDTTAVALGTAPWAEAERIAVQAQEQELAVAEIIDTYKGVSLLLVAAHRSVEQEFFAGLSALGFAHCSIKDDILPSQRIAELSCQIAQLREEAKRCRNQLAGHVYDVLEFELYYDYLELQLKKATAASACQKTQSCFVIEGFYPEESEQLIKDAIDSRTEFTLLYFNEVSDDDQVPVLYKNNKFVDTFEPVTNMYTPPSYREIDPNPVMSIFYLIIFGLMVADMGYGLVLSLVGLGAARLIKQQTGIKRLAKLFGVCGFGAIAVGALYGTFFSMTLYTGLIPDPSVYPKTTMVICILFGILHLAVGFLANMAKELSRKNYVAAFGVSLMWAVFFAGAFMFVLQPALGFMDYAPFAEVALPSQLSYAGAIVSGACLLVAMVCSGHGKGVGGRLISAFTSVYGILNYFGDVMSYIRIFGLMLSSAMMGVVINMLAGMVMGSGAVGVVLSVVLLVFAHLFNLVIGVLGVYIHDGRLQYVEFFGKFYEGDGRLFSPFGSNMKNTLIQNPSQK